MTVSVSQVRSHVIRLASLLAGARRYTWAAQPDVAELLRKLSAEVSDLAGLLPEDAKDHPATIARTVRDYRPQHQPECPARDPRVNVDRLRIAGDGSMTMERICTCPPERFAPGSKPIYEPGDGPASGRTGD